MANASFEVSTAFANTSTDEFGKEIDLLCTYDYGTVSSTTGVISALGFFPIGFLGNCLTIFTLTRPRNCNSATAFFLTILAASDNIILLTGSFYVWITGELGIYNTTEVECRLSFFLGITSIQISSWTLAVISTERTLYIVQPLRAEVIFTRGRAMLTCGCIILFFCSLNIIFVIFKTKRNGENVCCFDELIIPFYLEIFPVLDFLFTFLLPCIILVVTSFIIIATLQKRMKGQKESNIVTTVAVMMLLVNFVFFMTMLPFCVYQFIDSAKGDTSSMSADTYYILLQVTELNPVLNFPLYCLANKRFRSEVKSLLLKCQSENNDEGVFGGKASRL